MPNIYAQLSLRVYQRLWLKRRANQLLPFGSLRRIQRFKDRIDGDLGHGLSLCVEEATTIASALETATHVSLSHRAVIHWFATTGAIAATVDGTRFTVWSKPDWLVRLRPPGPRPKGSVGGGP